MPDPVFPAGHWGVRLLTRAANRKEALDNGVELGKTQTTSATT
jgi:hypothetical protein